MDKMLLAAAAALAALALPATATAQDRAGLHVGGSTGGTAHNGRHHDRDRHDRRRNRDSDGVLIASWDREWQGDTAWRADSFNDWWHERPWRSYPRWVQDKHDCEPDRMWWSGSGWHC
jgi:hypothetical protein